MKKSDFISFPVFFYSLNPKLVWRKTISLVILFAFVFPLVAWAFEPANLLAGFHGVFFQHKPVDLPKQLGKITEFYPGQDCLVVHIQDLHCSYEVQKNIARIIDWLAENHGLKLVGIEGASLGVNVTKLSTFPVASVKEGVGDYFVKEGRMSGAEYYAATGRHAVWLEGVERKENYLEEKKCADQFLENESQGWLEDLKDNLDALKPQVYSGRLLEVDERKVLFAAGKLEITGYASFLLGKARQNGLAPTGYEQITKCVSGRAGDETEQEALLAELEGLEQEVRAGCYTDDNQRQLDEYLRRVKVLEKLFAISATPAEWREFRDQPWEFNLHSWLGFIQAHAGDGVELDTEWLQLESTLPAIRRFYAVADQRSLDFVKNLSDKMNERKLKLAVLTTGGFHTRQVLDQLRKLGIGYLSIQPRLTRQDLVNPYFALLKNRHTPLEKLLAENQEKYALQPFFAEGSDTTEVLQEEALPAELQQDYFNFQSLLELWWLNELFQKKALGRAEFKQEQNRLKKTFRFSPGSEFDVSAMVFGPNGIWVPLPRRPGLAAMVCRPGLAGLPKPLREISREGVRIAFYAVGQKPVLLRALDKRSWGERITPLDAALGRWFSETWTGSMAWFGETAASPRSSMTSLSRMEIVMEILLGAALAGFVFLEIRRRIRAQTMPELELKDVYYGRKLEEDALTNSYFYLDSKSQNKKVFVRLKLADPGERPHSALAEAGLDQAITAMGQRVAASQKIEKMEYKQHSLAPRIYAWVKDGAGRRVGYIAEYILGENLRLLLRNGNVEAVALKDIMIQIEAQLELLHASGVAHGEMRAENIKVEFNQGKLVVRLDHFQLADRSASCQKDDAQYQSEIKQLILGYNRKMLDEKNEILKLRADLKYLEFLKKLSKNIGDIKAQAERLALLLHGNPRFASYVELLDLIMAGVKELDAAPIWTLSEFRKAQEWAGVHSGHQASFDQQLSGNTMPNDILFAKNIFIQTFDSTMMEISGFLKRQSERPRPSARPTPQGGSLQVSFLKIVLGVVGVGGLLVLASWLDPHSAWRGVAAWAGSLAGLGLAAYFLPKVLAAWFLSRTPAQPPLTPETIQNHAGLRSLVQHVQRQGGLPERFQTEVPEFRLLGERAKASSWLSRLWQGTGIAYGEDGVIYLHPNFLSLPYWLQHAMLQHELHEAAGQGHWLATLQEFKIYAGLVRPAKVETLETAGVGTREQQAELEKVLGLEHANEPYAALGNNPLAAAFAKKYGRAYVPVPREESGWREHLTRLAAKVLPRPAMVMWLRAFKPNPLGYLRLLIGAEKNCGLKTALFNAQQTLVGQAYVRFLRQPDQRTAEEFAFALADALDPQDVSSQVLFLVLLEQVPALPCQSIGFYTLAGKQYPVLLPKIFFVPGGIGRNGRLWSLIAVFRNSHLPGIQLAPDLPGPQRRGFLSPSEAV